MKITTMISLVRGLKNASIALTAVMTFFSILLAPNAQAGTKTWNSASGSSWNTAGNWFASGVPGSADDVILDNSLVAIPGMIGLDAALSANSLTFGSGSGTALDTFTLQANTSANTARTLTLTSGSMTNASQVTGTITVGGNSGTYGVLTLASSAAGFQVVNNNLTQMLDIAAIISGTKTLTLNSSGGSIRLGGNNSFTGQLTVETGILAINSDIRGINGSGGSGPLGNSALAVILGKTSSTGTLQYTGITASSSKKFTMATGGTGAFQVDTAGSALTLSGIIDGSGNLTKTGAGTLTLAGANTYTGNTAFNAGTINAGIVESANVTGPFGKQLANAAGTLLFGGGTLQFSSVNATDYSGRFSTAGSQAIGIDPNGRPITFATAIQGTGTSLTLNDTAATKGTLTLTAANSYDGATTLNNGQLVLKNSGTGLTQTLGALTLAGPDVTLQSTNAASGDLSTTFTTVTRAAGGTANIISTGNANNRINLTQTAGFIDKGVFFNSADYAAIDATTFVRALAYGTDTDAEAVNTITASKHVKLTSTPGSRAGDTLLSLNLAGSGVGYTMSSGTLTVPGIIKSGAGTVGTISGGDAVTAGNDVELVIRASLSTDLLTITPPVIGTGTAALTKSGAGTLTLSGVNTYAGTTTINGGTLTIDSAGQLGSGTYTNAIVNNGTFNYNSSAPQTLSGVISGLGSLAKATGTSTLILSGTNTYTGATTISAGTLKLGNSMALGNGSIVNIAAGAILDLNGSDLTIGSLGANTATSIITNSSGPGTSTLTINGAIANNATWIVDNGINKVAVRAWNNNGSSGDLMLTNTNNTFSGGLVLGIGSGDTRLKPPSGTNGVLNTPGDYTSGVARGPWGRGPIIIGMNATDRSQIYLANVNSSVLNDIIVNSDTGTDQSGAFRTDGSGSVIFGGVTLNVTVHASGVGVPIIFAGPISGVGGLSMSGAPTILRNTTAIANSYSGDTSLNNGRLLTLGAANQIPDGPGKGNLILADGNGGGRFYMNGFSETVNSLTSAKANSIVDGVSGTPTLTVGNNDATSSYSGVIANSAGLLSLTKIGTGTLTLSGVNTYGGATVISNGTLVLSGSISNSASIHIAAGATFDVSGITAYTLSASNTLSAAGTATTANFKGKSGSTVSLGSRPITLTYNGTNPALTVTQGTLVLNGNPFTVNSATVLADGTYTLVSQTSGSITSSGPYPDAVCLANGSRKTGTISVVGGNVLLKVETKGTLIQFF